MFKEKSKMKSKNPKGPRSPRPSASRPGPAQRPPTPRARRARRARRVLPAGLWGSPLGLCSVCGHWEHARGWDTNEIDDGPFISWGQTRGDSKISDCVMALIRGILHGATVTGRHISFMKL